MFLPFLIVLFCFFLIFLPTFTYIAYFHNFRISSFLVPLFFRAIASLILFTLLTLLFPIFCMYFTLFPQIICFYFVLLHLLPVNYTEPHHFVAMPAQHVRPFPHIQYLYDQHFAAKLSKVVDRTDPSPARAQSLDGSFAINRSQSCT